jgi:aspartate/methionine/tyrosine aminotransferase
MPFSPSRRADFGPERPAPPPSPFDLTRSLPDDVGLAWPVDESLLPLRRPEAARYVPAPCGSAEARAAVARFLETLDAPCAADELVLASGTSDLIARLFEALTDPGDDILVPEPGYPLLDMILRTLGVVPDVLPASARRPPSRRGGSPIADRSRGRRRSSSRVRTTRPVGDSAPTT